MIGTIVNAVSIVTGTIVGLIFKKGIPEQVKETVMQGIGLAVLLVGLMMAFKTGNILIVISSLVLGGICGEFINIEGWLTRLGVWIESKVGDSGSNVARAFVTTSLIYCVGAMAVLGAIEDGLTGNPSTLFAKSMLDGVTAIFFASTMGLGVMFSAIPVLLYQGSITLLASSVSQFLSPPVINELTSTGGLLIVGIALNILNIRQIKVGNLLPAIPFAVIIAVLVERLL